MLYIYEEGYQNDTFEIIVTYDILYTVYTVFIRNECIYIYIYTWIGGYSLAELKRAYCDVTEMMGTDWGDDPQMAELFRLVNSYHLSRWVMVIFVKMGFESKFYYVYSQNWGRMWNHVIPLWDDDPQNWRPLLMPRGLQTLHWSFASPQLGEGPAAECLFGTSRVRIVSLVSN